LERHEQHEKTIIMKARQNSTRWLGLALVCGTLTFAVSTQAGKSVKPPPPPPPPPAPTLTYTLIPFDNGTRLGSVATAISEAGLIPGYFNRNLVCDGVTDQYSWPTVATPTDANRDGWLDLPLALPIPDIYMAGWASDANDFGMIVGATHRVYNYDPPYPYINQEGVIWLPGTTGYVPQRLGVIDARLDVSSANRVNKDGVVAGVCSSYTAQFNRAFVIQPEQTADGLTWFRDANADGVNDLMRQIWPGPDPRYITWYYDPNDPWTDPPPGPWSEIYDLNDAGTVCGMIQGVGGFVVVPDYSDADGDGNPWFAANAAGNNRLVRTLPPLTKGAGTSPVSINTKGEIAGVSGNHAVLWKPVAGGGYAIQDLGTVSVRQYLRVSAMSDTGWMVGTAYNSISGSGGAKNPQPNLTVVWRNGVKCYLPDVLTNGAGWTNLSFRDVSNTGVLAGYGVFKGKGTACLAVPNLP
jgi:hypothetical protein